MNEQIFEAFITARTRLVAPIRVPEILLHTADACLPLWQTLEEQRGMAEAPPYWAFPWPGGQALARHLLDHPGLCRGRSVLDLGCGSGIAAIAAARSGALRVAAADIDPLALAAVRLNAVANGVHIETVGHDLLQAPPDEALAGVDLLLIGDLFYERELASRILAFATAASVRGALVLAGDPRRSYFPAGNFEQLASYPVPVSPDLEDVCEKETGVFRLPPAAAPSPAP